MRIPRQKSHAIPIIILSAFLLTSCSSNASYSSDVKTQNYAPEETRIVGDKARQTGTYADGSYSATGEGKYGPIEVEMRIRNGFIDKIVVKNHEENPALVEDAFKQLNKRVIESQSANVDVVSGATEASRGHIEAVADCIRQAERSKN